MQMLHSSAMQDDALTENLSITESAHVHGCGSICYSVIAAGTKQRRTFSSCFNAFSCCGNWPDISVYFVHH